jgi:hypothetical protein
MKDTYIPPVLTVTEINIENSLCNTSSTIQVGNTNEDYLQEWEELNDDNRFIEW